MNSMPRREAPIRSERPAPRRSRPQEAAPKIDLFADLMAERIGRPGLSELSFRIETSADLPRAAWIRPLLDDALKNADTVDE
jgi:hypothetical protein